MVNSVVFISFFVLYTRYGFVLVRVLVLICA